MCLNLIQVKNKHQNYLLDKLDIYEGCGSGRDEISEYIKNAEIRVITKKL